MWWKCVATSMASIALALNVPPMFECGEVHGQPAIQHQHELRAAFVLNIARFAEWPQGSFLSQEEPMTVSVLGNRQVFEAFLQTIEGKQVNGRQVKVRWAQGETDPILGHVIFVSSTASIADLEKVNVLDKQPILTVGESKRFQEEGGIIFIKEKRNRLSFEVNLLEAVERRITISSSVLNLADKVKR